MKKFGIGIAVLTCAVLVLGTAAYAALTGTRTFTFNIGSIYFDLQAGNPTLGGFNQAEIAAGQAVWNNVLAYDIDDSGNYKLTVKATSYTNQLFLYAIRIQADGPHGQVWKGGSGSRLNNAQTLIDGNSTWGSWGDKGYIDVKWVATAGQNFPNGTYTLTVDFVASEG